MPDRSFLRWPWFDDRHRRLADELAAWADAHLPDDHPETEAEVDAACRVRLRALAEGGWLRHAVVGPAGAGERLDARTLCLIRETLAYHDPLADFVFAMQGLGAGPLSLFGSDELRQRWLPAVAAGEAVAAFALSEREAGSDLRAMRTVARRDGDGYVLDGEKTWISNAGLADFYVVFCRLKEAGEDAGHVALLVPAGAPGLEVTERIATLSPHPLGTLRFDGCVVPEANRVGTERSGLRTALGTLDVFRPTVGAAALGFARRALDEAARWSLSRAVGRETLADQQMTQARLAEMAVDVDAAALLVYRAAWTRDAGAERTTRESAMAKLHATEAAQRVIDGAVQLLGGRGVVGHHPVARLYREVRALRIYEGTSEIQKLVIAGQLLRGYAEEDASSSPPSPSSTPTGR